MSDMGSEIAGFYSGRSIFITGASGFIGKVLLEKLLRSCPDISNIYILIRPKRGCTVKERMTNLLNSNVFDGLKSIRPSALSKIIPVKGDITEPKLGISPADEETIVSNVSIVFHSAATVRFDEPLKSAVKQNIVGTKSVVELCRNITNLAALIYVSTAYSNCHKTEELQEVLYPPPADPHKIVDWIQWMDDDIIDDITPRIIGSRPNTYTYTKALAEHLFADMAAHLPAAIVRPSIVGASWKEPCPGWIDSLNGPTAMMAGIGKGLIRTIMCDASRIVDMVPVDLVVNLLVALAWRTATVRTNNVQIYNSCSSTVNPMAWGLWRDVIGSHMVTNPFRQLFWYPSATMHNSNLKLRIEILLLHMLPAHLFDTIFKVLGKKPFLVNLQKKIWRNYHAIQYFTQREWRFSCHSTTQLKALLTKKDRQAFNFDVTTVQWPEYLRNYFDGVKYYIFKDNPKETSNISRMYVLNRLLQIFLFFALFKVFQLTGPSLKRCVFTCIDAAARITQCLPFKT